jgi:hypothetical protein
VTPRQSAAFYRWLQIGTGLTDATGEWEVASRPYVTNTGKDAHVRVNKVG